MPDYDFKALSPIDFEILVRDVLQAQLKIRFETFKLGADKGIDLRYSHVKKQSIIVQCKHYANSNFRSLLRHLLKDELPKVRKLNPKRYILATSLDISPGQKEYIVKNFAPFVQVPSDIYGREDINNLLGLHPKIEKQTFKLWFSSIAIFEEILERKVKNVSRDALEKIRVNSRFYVKNPSFDEVISILRKSNFCIITGIPGIGKTTLAEMLILHYISLKYDFVKVESDISEVRGIDYVREKRIFYYDDFLGQASFSEKFNKNEDQKLLDFLHAIKGSRVSKMLLTTREYILNQAKQRYEKFDRSDYNVETCVIDLSKYTRMIRAQILFNHLYFSDLPKVYKKVLLKDPRYLEIIDHENYSPRIIELMTEVTRLKNIPPTKYVSFFIGNLDDPFEIWRHAFEQQLSHSAKNLLLTLVCLPTETELSDLQSAFTAFHTLQANEFGFTRNPEDFKRALKELDGNFTKTTKDDVIRVSFHNPSVRDFIQNHILANENNAVMLVRSAVFFEQLMWTWQFERRTTGSPAFQHAIKSDFGSFTTALRRTIGVRGLNRRYRLVHGEWRFDFLSLEERLAFVVTVLLEMKSPALQRLLINQITSIELRLASKKPNQKDLIFFLKNLQNLASYSMKLSLITKVHKYLLSESNRLEDIQAYCDFADLFPYLINRRSKKVATQALWKAAENIEGEEDPDTVRESASVFHSLADRLGVDGRPQVDAFEDRAKELERKAKEKEDKDEDAYPLAKTEDADEYSDQEIKSLFNTMLI